MAGQHFFLLDRAYVGMDGEKKQRGKHMKHYNNNFKKQNIGKICLLLKEEFGEDVFE